MSARRKVKPVHRRWWQLLVRAAVVVALLAASLYVTLPWWLPKDMVRRYVAEEMSRQMGVEASIAEVSASWSRGIVLRDLRIHSDESFGGEPMARVAEIRMDLSPLKMLFNESFDRMVLAGAEMDVRVDESGNVNVAPLSRLEFDVAPRRVSLSNGALTFATASSDHVIRFDIADLQIDGGRIEDISRVTMSARLRQEELDAPVSLQMGESVMASAAATASLNFGNVDLSQLPLPRMLQLPLRELSGRCDGSIDLQLDRRGIVDRCIVDFDFRNLSIQPDDGVELPVVETAAVRLSARLDPIEDVLEIESARVDMPGVELTGRGRMSTAFGGGSWDSLEELDFRARVHPDRLTAMLGRDLPDGLNVAGPVQVVAKVRHDGAEVRMEAEADASGATVARDGRILKPEGRKLRAELSGLLNDRNWRFRSDTCELELADNSVSGSLTVNNFRRLMRTDVSSAADVLEALRDVGWRCRWTIADLPAVTDLFDPVPWGEGLRLSGSVSGRLVLEPGRRPHVDASMKIPADTELSIGPWFTKPAGEELTITYQGRIEPDEVRLGEGLTTLAIGSGRLVAGDITLALAREPDGRMSLQGRFYAASVQDLVQCFRTSDNLEITGAFSGRCMASAGPQGMSASVFADFSGTSLRVKSLAVKPVDEACSLSLRLSASEPVGGAWNFSGELRSAWATAAMEGIARNDRQGEAELSLSIRDAARLAERVPPLKRALGDARLTGVAEAEGKVQWDQRGPDVRLAVDATGLEYRGGDDKSYKAAGTPARLEAFVHASNTGAGPRVNLETCKLRFGESTASVSSTVGGNIPKALNFNRPLDGAIDLDARVETLLVCDDALRELLPDLDRQSRKYELQGELGLEARVRTNGGSLEFDAELDATDLSGKFAEFPGSEVPEELRRLGLSTEPAVKPAGAIAKLSLSGSAQPDLSRIELHTLTAELGGAKLSSEASLSRPGKGGSYRLKTARAELSVEQTGTVQTFLPCIEPWSLGGSLSVRLDYSDRNGATVEHLTLDTDNLTGHVGGKEVLLDGEITLESISDIGRDIPRIHAVRSDKLQIQAGDNRAWLLLDLENLDRRPTGRADVLCEYVDDLDLMQWLLGEDAPPAPDEELSSEEVSELQDESRRLVLLARQYLSQADLTLNLRARWMRTFDPRVGEAYVVNNLRLEGTAVEGHVRVDLIAGLNGGTYQRELEVDLSESTPAITSRTEMSNVIATESIQPQLALYFPGNTVNGEFNRTENLTMSLRDMLAQAMDPRHPLRAVGRAKTVTIDGVVVGRAAPKFVTRIFPGLNLARYEYRKMTSFTEFLPDGTAVNDMIFKGPIYDVYIEGTTDAENMGEYEIGLILLSTPQSAEWNHAYRQGRIPILHFNARIEGGELHDTKVWYFWPNETLFTVFLKNNLFYRIWMEAGKDNRQDLPHIE